VRTVPLFNAGNILMLLGGGAALGVAVQSSGLLELVSSNLYNLVEDQEFYVTFCVFCAGIMLLANFIRFVLARVPIHVGNAICLCRLGPYLGFANDYVVFMKSAYATHLNSHTVAAITTLHFIAR